MQLERNEKDPREKKVPLEAPGRGEPEREKPPVRDDREPPEKEEMKGWDEESE